MKLPQISVAIAVVHKNGRWLVAKRHPHVHLGGKWEFPGGKNEPGENARQTALRELHEECGVRAVVECQLAPLNCDYGDRIVRLTPIICRWTDGEPQPLGCACVNWVTLDQMARLDMPAANAAIIQTLASMNDERPE